ncbi:MAG: addiction module protein [Pseudolysinimonas sp.]|jgi:putative addiction module component (TIGR02574 family)|uniref:addiction module protein n=1 Tax=Pseudolysinimonas sp. TaxID=2680009 RepID=UPI003C74F870
MVDPRLLAQAKGLDVADRVELINELWDSIDANELPVSPGTADLIDERIREADATPLEGRPWEDVEAELRARLP